MGTESGNPASPSDAAGQDLHKLELQRRANRDAAARLGASPYGASEKGLASLVDAAARYDAAADAEQKERGKEPGFVDRRPVVKVAGRVVLHRDNGKLVWMNLRDHTGDLQIAVSQKDCAAAGFELAKLTDLGDVVVASGPLVKTRTGEVTVWASSLAPAAKCLVPPPEKHAGLHDVEMRYRQRYVDLWATPETMRVFRTRSMIVSEIRRILDSRGFQEVETPMLQTLAGGAAARPFVTHMNALDIDLYLRIAPELYLKRLLVGGMPRVYEINRNFRNEGLDKQHNPEFTMLEVYEAFGDCATVMQLTEDVIRACAAMVARNEPGLAAAGDLRLPFGDLMIDYGSPFARVTYAELFERALGFPMTDGARARAEAVKRHVVSAEAAPKMDDILIVNELFEEVAEKSIDPARPTFITEYPAALSPLTRPKPGSPAVAERADLFIAHMELAPHYTELNDPDVQEAKFREQLKGIDDEEQTFRTFDDDFIRALKVGMPPAGGLGLGIDRLTMVLTNQRTIRDVMLFPMMRPVTA
ncbi:MAG: lysine--tRNA ligase [Phycisphaeraceae bacterium]|nr:lysine--tRNA ligase [Phycisphaeraceae bacterium]